MRAMAIDTLHQDLAKAKPELQDSDTAAASHPKGPQLMESNQNAEGYGKGKQGKKHGVPGKRRVQALSRQSSEAMRRLLASRASTSSSESRSEEHTSELQSLMRISYAVFCLTKKRTNKTKQHRTQTKHNHRPQP